MAAVTVRAFGALRDLVGARQQLDVATVQELLGTLRDRHGEEFDRRMTRSSVVVGDVRVDPTDATPLSDGVEVVLLPPFAGG